MQTNSHTNGVHLFVDLAALHLAFKVALLAAKELTKKTLPRTDTMPLRKWHDYDAMLQQFDMDYGSDETRLIRWQRLCTDCGVQIGPSIRQCKRVHFPEGR